MYNAGIYMYRVKKKGSFNFTEDLVCHIEVRAFFYSFYIQLLARCNIV